MLCPHCLTTISVPYRIRAVGFSGKGGHYATSAFQCPACSGVTLDLMFGQGAIQENQLGDQNHAFGGVIASISRVYPRTSSRPPLPPEVPEQYAADYNEAALVLRDSPKASAALSRRCLQHILQGELKIAKANLFQEIEEAIRTGGLPSQLAESLDAVRNIGNFAAHPKKSTASGEIIDVEPGEAEWSLDVLDGLFDHLFVGPAKLRARRAALDAKLAAAKGH
jgi:Domain of unknown function (DUF4145)